ncbi:protein CTR9 homolog isoform X2 [Asparagus officinalis]|uniref:protein CTR9 homolog isoform X2 n=1 Tax=Asparagus officinalis TaxID=4686 RepID=UPI00098E30D8|nr:protein CTR9 homolog isoform X2 [Asparagus officinalis]
MASVYIPVQNSEEVVRVVLDQLPRDADDILDILKAEQAPLDLWLTIAREYFKQGKFEQFRKILEEGSSPEIDEYYADIKYERIAILNALGAYHTYLGKTETKQREKDEHFQLAIQYYNRSSRIDVHESSTWIRKGQLFMAKGDIQQASCFFKIVLDEDPNNVPALLGQACVEFNLGENEEQPNKALVSYSNSLKLFRRALQVHPNCPGAVRLGIGLCCYRLGPTEKAQQTFRRVLQLDPENVEALVALGITDLQTDEAIGIQKGMEKLQRAFEIYPYCSMALNHLANHFFFTGQHFLVEQLTESALATSNHALTRSHSYYNLGRSYHSKGDFEKAGCYYMASVKEINRKQDFVLPYYGLGQVQLKSGDLRSSLSNFEKVLEVYPENCECLKTVGHIYIQLHKNEKALEIFRRATRSDPRDAQAFIELGELLISSDPQAALDAYRSALSLSKKDDKGVPTEILNNMGVLYFETGEFEMAAQTFKEALGDGIWVSFLNGSVDCSTFSMQYRDLSPFHQLKEDGASLNLPWDKVTILFNYSTLLEKLHDTEKASILYQFLLFKIGDALRIDDKCHDALCMLGSLELKNDDWLRAKDTFRAAREATHEKDSYSTLFLGNWNYFAATPCEKRFANFEAMHLEKAKDLYTKVLKLHPGNLYAANGTGAILAEKGHLNVSKDIFSEVQEAASGSIFVQMPDVWVNLGHVYFAQAHFVLAVKMYQNCLRKFYYNTDTEILLYFAFTHYWAEQWKECKRTLQRAIHLAPSDYTLRFDLGVALQKFSASTLQKKKRTADEVWTTVTELKHAIRVFSQLYAASSYHIHGFDERKIKIHVDYCKHLLDAAKVHLEAAECEEQQKRQRLEVARQLKLAEEAQRKAEEQKKIQAERKNRKEELEQFMQQDEHLKRIQEQLKIFASKASSKLKERTKVEHDESGVGGKRRRKGGKRTKRGKKSKTRFEHEQEQEQEQEAEMGNEPKAVDEGDANMMNYQEEDGADTARDNSVAAGLEDSDAEEDMGAPSNRKKRSLAEFGDEDDQPSKPHPKLKVTLT